MHRLRRRHADSHPADARPADTHPQLHRRRRARPVALALATALTLTGCAADVVTMVDPGHAASSLDGTSIDPTAEAWALLRDAAPGLLPASATFVQPAPAVTTLGAPIVVTLPASDPAPATGPGATGSVAPTLDPTADAATGGPLGAWATSNVGLSFEASDLADARWEPGSSNLDDLIGALDAPSLRFGGNSIDRRVWWTSSGEPAPEWAEVTLTPADLQRLGRFADAVDATVTMSLDLGHDDPERAADMAAAAHDALGERLRAVSIGNEPNGFFLGSQPQYAIRGADWGPEAYAAQLASYAEAVHARVPGLAIVGPGAFDAPWWRAFIDADVPGTVALGQHWYPLWSCPGRQGQTDAAAEPVAANLVSPALHDRAATIVGMGVTTAREAGLPVWMEETGPTSCVGTNDSSRTHAQALWTIDYALHAASLGVERMNFHSMLDACRGGAPMSVVCDRGGYQAGTPDLAGQANYLSLLLASFVRPGDFVPVQLAGDERVFAYAVRDANGYDLVLVNLHDPATEGASPLVLELPAGARAASAAQLAGPAYDAVGATTLAPPAPVAAGSLATLGPGTATLIRIDAPAA